MSYSRRYNADGYTRKYGSWARKPYYHYVWRRQRSPLKVPLPTPLAFQVAWVSKTTSVVGPAGMSNSQYA